MGLLNSAAFGNYLQDLRVVFLFSTAAYLSGSESINPERQRGNNPSVGQADQTVQPMVVAHLADCPGTDGRSTGCPLSIFPPETVHTVS